MRADSALPRIKEGPQALHACLFDEGNHDCGGQNRRHVAKARPGIVDLRYGVKRRDQQAFDMAQSDSERRRRGRLVHIVPNRMLIGHETGSLRAGSPQRAEMSCTKLSRMSSRPASLTRRTADQVDR
ncbi:hypothetical protein D3C80_1235690 [compost metagenome]